MHSAETRVILLDIEGTTSSVSYVFDIMYPFSQKKMPAYLASNWDSEKVQAACNQLAVDVGEVGLSVWGEGAESEQQVIDRVVAEANKLIVADVKATGLKEIQGLIWAEGYEAGELKSHFYPDVLPAIEAWKDAGFDIRIFSSGSIKAQKVFFKYTEYGDLAKYLSGHYDTTTGPKRESNSYKLIAEDSGVKPSQVAFLSDVIEELDAAREAGMKTVLVRRPGNKPVIDDNDHHSIESFDQLKLSLAV